MAFYQRLRVGGIGRLTLWMLVAGIALLPAVPVLGQVPGQDGEGAPTSTTDSLAPTALSGSIELSGVVLSWTAPTLDSGSVNGYEISRRRLLEYETSWLTIVEDSAVEDSAVEDSADLATAHTDASANVNGASYEYQVRALRGESDDRDVSAGSNVIELTIPNPAKLRNLTASSTANGVQLSWDAAHLSWQPVTLSQTGYEIIRLERSHADHRRHVWEVLVDRMNNTDTTYLDETGYATIEYQYAIRAVHGFVRSSWEGIAGPVAGHLLLEE